MTLTKPDDFEAIPGHGIRVKIDEKYSILETEN